MIKLLGMLAYIAHQWAYLWTHEQVFDTALEAAVRWCTPGIGDGPQDLDDAGLSGDFITSHARHAKYSFARG